jgi:hypothetical protein
VSVDAWEPYLEGDGSPRGLASRGAIARGAILPPSQ